MILKFNEMDQAQIETILKRSKTDVNQIKEQIQPIIDDVKENGDTALVRYTKQFDNFELKDIKVSKEDIKEAYTKVDPKIIQAIKYQIKYAKRFAELDTINLKDEIKTEYGILGKRKTPIDSVGLYIPGGTAQYPTVMQILAVAAKTAGVKKIIACTPPRDDMDILMVAADLAGVDELYRVGGVQSIAAMAYGTETIPKVLKIVGPGNVYVTAAKVAVFGEVSIDMPAGPSEAVIIADETANPRYCAADILARCEHDTNAAAVMLTDSMELAKQTVKELEIQKTRLSRLEIIEKSLKKYSAIIVFNNLDQAFEFSNEYAPEHLEILTKDPKAELNKITNAGSVFLGAYSPVGVGDYASGVNHVLPTNGFAKMFSGVSVDTFMKTTEYEMITKPGLQLLYSEIIKTIADVEKLDAHKRSVEIRL
ncbi:MAG: histidinol dehydrogenase [Nanoarchaeota archaeon]|nr:histidinol dehydrogenase [Nanoarchaeota archaeon]